MPLLNDTAERREINTKAALLLVAVAINTLEFFIPRIPLFPWMKPGLANIVTIIWIVRWGFADALLAAPSDLDRQFLLRILFSHSGTQRQRRNGSVLCHGCLLASAWKTRDSRHRGYRRHRRFFP
jgi:hypothetical protein